MRRQQFTIVVRVVKASARAALRRSDHVQNATGAWNQYESVICAARKRIQTSICQVGFCMHLFCFGMLGGDQDLLLWMFYYVSIS